MLNRITITGRLTADPELRKTASDISVTSFSIANQRNFKNSNGERDTDFYDVTAWRTTAETVTKYFTKGAMITIDGRLESRKYKDKNGNNRTAISIIAENVFFGDSKKDSQENNSPSSNVMDDGEFVPDFSVGSSSDFEEITGDDDFPF